ncbi:MAG: alpha/beta fold hydrolase [Cyclobacteriaceae bacterium]
MPASNNFDYVRPAGLFNGHMETIYPAFFRRITCIPKSRRERIDTPDNDFLDVDWFENDSSQVVIISHGLEGSSRKPYVLGMAKCFHDAGFDALAWNYRSCSGEMNRGRRMYHSGATDDLASIVELAAAKYSEIFLVSFSLGGNLVLKYLGERTCHPKIKKAVAISVPLDLHKSVQEMNSAKGWIYEKRFISNLLKKAKIKANQHPDIYDVDNLKQIKSLYDFDDLVTSRIHGFENAADYYQKCSSKNFLSTITIPTLVLNAMNDPINSKDSCDHELFKDLKHVYLESTKQGGHVGFAQLGSKPYYWSEERALRFCQENMNEPLGIS